MGMKPPVVVSASGLPLRDAAKVRQHALEGLGAMATRHRSGEHFIKRDEIDRAALAAVRRGAAPSEIKRASRGAVSTKRLRKLVKRSERDWKRGMCELATEARREARPELALEIVRHVRHRTYAIAAWSARPPRSTVPGPRRASRKTPRPRSRRAAGRGGPRAGKDGEGPGGDSDPGDGAPSKLVGDHESRLAARHPREPFVKVPASLIRASAVGDTAVALFAVLQSHAREGSARPGEKRCARMLGCSERTVSRAVHELKDNGWLTVGKRGRSNVYTLRQDSGAFAMVPPALVQDETLLASHRRLAFALFLRRGEDGSAYPGIDRLAQSACVSPRTAKRAVASIENRGYVAVRRGRRGVSNGQRGRFSVNRYVLPLTFPQVTAASSDHCRGPLVSDTQADPEATHVSRTRPANHVNKTRLDETAPAIDRDATGDDLDPLLREEIAELLSTGDPLTAQQVEQMNRAWEDDAFALIAHAHDVLNSERNPSIRRPLAAFLGRVRVGGLGEPTWAHVVRRYEDDVPVAERVTRRDPLADWEVPSAFEAEPSFGDPERVADLVLAEGPFSSPSEPLKDIQAWSRYRGWGLLSPSARQSTPKLGPTSQRHTPAGMPEDANHLEPQPRKWEASAESAAMGRAVLERLRARSAGPQ